MKSSSSISEEQPRGVLPSGMVLSVAVLGASGDLAKKKTYPALFTLFAEGFLPKNVRIVGYARSAMDDEALRERVSGHLDAAPHIKKAFLDRCTYVQGPYDTTDGFAALNDHMTQFEDEAVESLRSGNGRPSGPPSFGRLIYLALPPSVYPQVLANLKKTNDDPPHSPCWVRYVVEKPFGRDLASSEELCEFIGGLFPEPQIYRIDHYLGKELAQNMLVLRFANMFLEPIWSRHYIQNVSITFKEPFGTEGRGGYFDTYGIVRDVMQNHLLQVMALLAMERPVSLSPEDIRDEKVKVLRCIEPARPESTVLGQYASDGKNEGYLEDPGVPKDSNTPTFAATVLKINNERWYGVPFFMKAGKALNEKKAEVRVQFRSIATNMFGKSLADPHKNRNELVMRFQPNEAIYMKMCTKKPGLDMDTTISELDLTYQDRFDARIPEAYERLILDALRGDQQHFVRRDELKAAWAVFDPLLEAIDNGEVPCSLYRYGTVGPREAYKLQSDIGYVRTANYHWKKIEGGSQRGSLDIHAAHRASMESMGHEGRVLGHVDYPRSPSPSPLGGAAKSHAL
ncbi:unnamed protein product [Pedinophyceae sp. YPF-701]|nr:unnamed protein product [Pedinophyceae sp. YPF-701]